MMASRSIYHGEETGWDVNTDDEAVQRMQRVLSDAERTVRGLVARGYSPRELAAYLAS